MNRDFENIAMPPHLAVWVDHNSARLIWLYRDRSVETMIHNHEAGASGHVHHHRGTPANGHAPLTKAFLESVSEAIGAAEEILILGPVEARHALRSFLERHKPIQARHVMGDETLDHGETAKVAARARQFFLHVDLMARPER